MIKLLAVTVMGVLLVPSAAFASFDVDLRYGSSGAEVLELQEFLTAEGVYTGPITGNFFSLTLAGVKAFQARENITPVSGFFGPLTRGSANDKLKVELVESDAEASTTPEVITSKTPKRKTGNTNNQSNDNDEDEDEEVLGGSFDIDVSVEITNQVDEDGQRRVYITTNDDFNYGLIEVLSADGSIETRGGFGTGSTNSGFSGGRAEVDAVPGTYTFKIEVWRGGRAEKIPLSGWVGGQKVTKTGEFVVE